MTGQEQRERDACEAFCDVSIQLVVVLRRRHVLRRPSSSSSCPVIPVDDDRSVRDRRAARQIIRDDARPRPSRSSCSTCEWLGDFVHGDLGNDYRGPDRWPTRSPTTSWNGCRVSLQLMLYAQILTLVDRDPARRLRGVPSRAASSTRRPTRARSRSSRCPNFVLALHPRVLGRREAGLAPRERVRRRSATDPVEHFQSHGAARDRLAVGQIAVYMRLLRSDMIATLQEDFIMMAKSKGITQPAHPLAARAAAVEPHAAHRRRPQRRHARSAARSSSRSSSACPAWARCSTEAIAARQYVDAAEPRRGHRDRLRARELRRRRPLRRPRPEDPACPSHRLAPIARPPSPLDARSSPTPSAAEVVLAAPRRAGEAAARPRRVARRSAGW